MSYSMNISRRALIMAAIVAPLAPTLSMAAKQNLSGGLAIDGYDPVAYFEQNKAVKGDASISAEHEGATYHFASSSNRDIFAANPTKFAPKYGGFCAYAVSKGYTAPIDPQAFSVVDGALYLNYSKGVRKIWSEDIPGNIELGDKNWPGLSAN